MIDHSHNLIHFVRDGRAFVSDDRNLTLLRDPPVFALRRVESGESGFWRAPQSQDGASRPASVRHALVANARKIASCLSNGSPGSDK